MKENNDFLVPRSFLNPNRFSLKLFRFSVYCLVFGLLEVSLVIATSSACFLTKCLESFFRYYFASTIYLFILRHFRHFGPHRLLLNFSREIHHVRGQFKIALLPGAPARARGRELDGRQIKDNPAHIDADIPLYFLLRYVHVDITRRR